MMDTKAERDLSTGWAALFGVGCTGFEVETEAEAAEPLELHSDAFRV